MHSKTLHTTWYIHNGISSMNQNEKRIEEEEECTIFFLYEFHAHT